MFTQTLSISIILLSCLFLNIQTDKTLYKKYQGNILLKETPSLPGYDLPCPAGPRELFPGYLPNWPQPEIEEFSSTVLKPQPLVLRKTKKEKQRNSFVAFEENPPTNPRSSLENRMQLKFWENPFDQKPPCKCPLIWTGIYPPECPRHNPKKKEILIPGKDLPCKTNQTLASKPNWPEEHLALSSQNSISKVMEVLPPEPCNPVTPDLENLLCRKGGINFDFGGVEFQ